MSAQHETPITPAEVDVIVVGAGFSGLYALHRLRQMGLSARVIEAGAGVGGTWYWNRYPGARCDVQSVDYQYSFSPELVDDWKWSERYPSQEELLNYLNHVADRFELRDDIQLNTRVEGLTYDEVAIRWAVSTDQGDQFRARFVILAVGCLSTAKMPEFTGLDDFGGHWYHTGSWPHDGVDFTGKRVAVIGTGSSGIQAIPVIADQAAEVVVFQRTPNYRAPAFNRALSQDDVRSTGADFERGRQLARESYFGFSEPFGDLPGMSVSDEARVEQYEKRWRMGGLSMLGAFDDILTDAAANDTVMKFFADKIREKVNDPAIAERLIPKGYRFGSKRMCVDTNYFETYNRDNVKLVDISADPIDRITHDGVLVGDNEYEVDAIVFATGFDAMTGSLVSIDIRGRKGISLRDKWAAGPPTWAWLLQDSPTCSWSPDQAALLCSAT